MLPKRREAAVLIAVGNLMALNAPPLPHQQHTARVPRKLGERGCSIERQMTLKAGSQREMLRSEINRLKGRPPEC